jgi:Ribulose-5-phosphate 4-epimerase and related epimerases and aldolases
MKATGEGVIKFRLHHEQGPPPDGAATAHLRAWFLVCRQLELLGQDPARYEGYAYGNLSCRHGGGFLVTCTQTGGKERLEAVDFSQVLAWDLAANRLHSRGPCRPSSEALTHAVIYETLPACRFVFHAHSPHVWRRAEALELPVTDPAAEYGTPEMAEATVAVLEATGHPSTGLLAMGGHEDGIVAWGETAGEAGGLLVTTLARALAME